MRFNIDGAEVKRRRLERGMSRAEVCRYAGCSDVTLWSLETERQQKTDEAVIVGIAAALDCNPSDIAPSYVAPRMSADLVWYDPDRLAKAREEKGLSLRAVAARTGYYYETIGRLEKPVGTPKAPPEKILRLCEVLGLDPATVAPALKEPERAAV
jgi:transcriptional regulator with XRE-family HTH domain